MFRATKDGKGLVELSIKQREHLVAYGYESALTVWPTLTISAPARRDTPLPFVEQEPRKFLRYRKSG